jgi:citrate synthase
MAATTELPRLSTAQAAARLSVKPATLYAYVSRGLLESRRAERGGSTFDPLEVEAFAADRSSRRQDAARSGRGEGRPLVVLDSPITLVEPDRLLYRGVPAVDLAERAGFLDAVAHLWAVPRDAIGPMRADDAARATLRDGAALLERLGAVPRLQLAVLAAGVGDPHRDEHGPAAAHRAGARILGTLIDALPARGEPADAAASPAARLWSRLSPTAPEDGDLALLEAALVLSMDHDLAVSTMAARMAASTRADPYACTVAALGAFEGVAHGSAGEHAHALVTETCATREPERALAGQVAAGHGTPGFGHVVYRAVDPRAEHLLARMRALPRYAAAVQAAHRLTRVVQERFPRPANIDLALAVLAVGAGFAPRDVTAVFAIARTVGWTAHVADEYTRPALRLRPQSHYTGALPAEPGPGRLASGAAPAPRRRPGRTAT